MDRRIALAIPELGVSASVRLLTDRAPLTCQAIWAILEEPVERRLIHTATTGPVVLFYDLPPIPDARQLPIENHTIYPKAGDILYFYQPWNGLRDLEELDPEWLRPGHDVHELLFAYGAANLRLPTEDGWRGSVWGRIETGLDEFSHACRRMRTDGTKRITLSRQI
jgi:Protein of unknown function (DUF3830)